MSGYGVASSSQLCIMCGDMKVFWKGDCRCRAMTEICHERSAVTDQSMRSEAWLFEIASEMEMRFTELNWDGDGMVRGNGERRKREMHSSTRKRSQAQMLSAQ